MGVWIVNFHYSITPILQQQHSAEVCLLGDIQPLSHEMRQSGNVRKMRLLKIRFDSVL